MQKYQSASGSSNGKGKQPIPPGKSPSKSPGKSRPIPRTLPPIPLCKCRDRVEEPTFAQGERLEWPLLREKILRVFPRSSNPIIPCEWGHKVVRQDANGNIWDLHYLELKECITAPSYMPVAPEAAPQVLLRGEMATRMSDALESVMNILDQMPYNWRYDSNTKLPIHAEEFPVFEINCSMCGLPRKDPRYLPPKPQTSHKLNLKR
ncbi:hypothetical protein KCU95_g1779, partial [Aureobasidium melanogenum]